MTTISSRGKELVKGFEALRLAPYQDQGGVWTIGYGHTGHDVFEGRTSITAEEAERLLVEDLAWAEGAVNTLVSLQLTQCEYDALVSFVFNVGKDAFSRSTLLKRLNAGEKFAVVTELVKWHNAGGAKSLGLLRRRLKEATLFAS